MKLYQYKLYLLITRIEKVTRNMKISIINLEEKAAGEGMIFMKQKSLDLLKNLANIYVAYSE